jgi:hypothetical protein
MRSRKLDMEGQRVRRWQRLHGSCQFVRYHPRVSQPSHRLNITLDAEHAARLARLAERTHVHEGTLARSLLSMAIEDADPEARNVTTLLDGIPNALERAQAGLERGLAGETVALDKL